jgi:hypothetical protein
MSLSRTDRLRPVTGILPAIRARWVFLPVGILLGLLAGVGAAAVVPTTFQAAGTVHLGAGLVSVGQMNPGSTWAADQVVLAGTPEVLQGIRDRVGGIDVDEVRRRLTVDQRDDTSYLDFTYTADTAEDAELGANAAMAVYLDAAAAAAQARLTEQSDLLTHLIETSPEWEQADLQQQLQSLNRTVVDPGEVAQTATDAERATVDLAAFPLAGALGGLLLAGAAAYLLEARSPRVRARTPHHHLGHLGLRSLGRLDPGGTALGPVAGQLHDRELPEGRKRPKVGVAVLSSTPDDVVGSVRQAFHAHPSGRKVKTVAVDLGTGSGIEAARDCDGLLLVAVEGRTGVTELEELKRRLDQLRLEALGFLTVKRRWARTFG